jgi:4-amino-4-deoxy-L-arabinose transferase-like glycosyltransferase
VFSFSAGIFHPYYTTTLAPAVAALAAGGLTEAWDRAKGSATWAVGLGAGVIGTAVLGAVILGRTSGFVPWLGPVGIGLGVLATGALVLRRRGGPTGRRLTAVALVAGTLALVAGPAAYSVATVGRSITGANPLAGPASVAAMGGPGGGGGFAGRGGFDRPGAGGFGPPAGAAGLGAPPPGLAGPATGLGGAGGGGLPGGGADRGGVSRTLVSYLEAHQGSARYLVAAVGSNTSAELALQSGADVINMGGFMGSDPAPSLAKVEQLVKSGQLRYVLLGGQRGGFGGPGAGRSTATTARDAWIRQHGKVVSVPGQSTSGAGTLYDLAGAA